MCTKVVLRERGDVFEEMAKPKRRGPVLNSTFSTAKPRNPNNANNPKNWPPLRSKSNG